MKFAVCSRSSTASRSPPSVIRGTPAVAILPMGFKRRSRILFVSLTVDVGGEEFVDDDTDQLALGLAERGDDVFHAIIDVELDRQDRDQSVGDFEQLVVGRAPRHGGSVDDDEIVAAGGTRLRDRLADGFTGLVVRSLAARS